MPHAAAALSAHPVLVVCADIDAATKNQHTDNNTWLVKEEHWRCAIPLPPNLNLAMLHGGVN
jgi:hypothetical protein